MSWSLDARIPVVIVVDGATLEAALATGGPTAVLAEAPAPAKVEGVIALAGFDPSGPMHVAGCACCAGRSAAAAALDRLFQARVRGACGWFERVVALAESDLGRAEVEEALRGDAMTAARFRRAEPIVDRADGEA